MKVLLKSDVKSLGKKNEIVEVSEGYARNFLLPRNLGVEATTGVMRSLQEQKANEKKREEKELEEAKKLAEKIAAVKVDIVRKVGEGGKLFGSVASKDIAERLKETTKIDIDKRKIELEEPIKSLGIYKVPVRVYAGVIAELEVIVKE
jgi:large subunit ribosomal protein L9